MKISDILIDNATGKMSHTKLWANIGYAVLTYSFLADSLAGHLTDLKMLVFGAIVAGSATASKIVSGIYFKGNENDTTKI